MRSVNFALGHPNPALLPIDAMKEALDIVKNQGDLTTYLNYPPNDHGNTGLLQELSLFLHEHSTLLDDMGDLSSVSSVINANDGQGDTMSSDVSSEASNSNTFFMTNGVSHAMDLLCGTLTEPGDAVAMEVPTYFRIAEIFKNHGLTLQALPMKQTDDDGIIMDVDKLEHNIEHGLQAIPRMIYTIPTHHNPTASTLPIKDRIQLAQLAHKHGIIVVADEVYHLLDWRQHIATNIKNGTGGNKMKQRPARMAFVDAALTAARSSKPFTSDIQGNHANQENMTKKPQIDGCCLSVSSFTKIFCPGIRCGWIEGPPEVINSLCQYGYIKSQGGCVPFIGELMRCALSSGLATKVLCSLQQAYYERSQLLCSALDDAGIEISVEPIGGYFLWIKLPGVATGAFAAYAMEHGGINILPGKSCDPFQIDMASKSSDDVVSSYARICFAHLSLDDLKYGARCLGELLKEYQAATEDTQ